MDHERAAETAGADPLAPYVPTLVRRWIADRPEQFTQRVEGTLLLLDVSGFTRLSERLARQGRVGAEELTDAIGRCVAPLLAVAYGHDGALVKFGGDALLLLFTGDGHAVRAARSAIAMRRSLREVGQVSTSAGRVRLRMSIGLHSSVFPLFLVGESHRELILAGPAASETVRLESAAGAGQILVSSTTAAALPPSVLGADTGAGRQLQREPPGTVSRPLDPGFHPGRTVLDCIPVAIRRELGTGFHEPEHRSVTVAFLHFDGTDELVARDENEAAAHLHELVRDVQHAVDDHGVTFLGTDADQDGGKIILVAGAPSSSGFDEERMLLALRQVMDRPRAVPLRVGVNRGHVFAGDVGPAYRCTYTVMGDAVNLAARLMAAAAPGEILATPDVLEASRTRFETSALPPLAVKGKRRPVTAHKVSARLGSRADATSHSLPLVGRDREVSVLRGALAAARNGQGRVVELVGEPGIGKSRLVSELRAAADDVVQVSASCDPYEAAAPYLPIRRVLKALLGAADAPDDEVVERLEAVLREGCPGVLPWTPLVGAVLGVAVAPTPETTQLAEDVRRAALHRAVLQLLQCLLPGPTLLTVEDAQWMDEASAAFFLDLGSALATRSWMLCVTRRDLDVGLPPLPGTHVDRLELRPLDPAAAAALTHAATATMPLSSHATDALVRRSGGNPLFLAELVEAAGTAADLEELPDSLEALITVRIDRLPADDRAALRYLAVLGTSFPRDLASAVLPPDHPDREGVLTRLGGFLASAEGDTVAFSHPLVREVAYEALSYRLRRRLHAEVGAALEQQAGDDPDRHADLLSYHFLHASRHADAWRYSLVAAEAARALHANVSAEELYRRALTAASRHPDLAGLEVARVHEALGDVRDVMGSYTRAAAAYRAARPLVAGDAVSEARLLLKVARTQGWRGRFSPALRSIRRALHMIEGLDTPDAHRQRAQLLAWYAAFCQESGRHGKAVEWARRAIEEGQRADERESVAHAYKLLDWAYMGRGQPERAVHSAAALEIYEELDDLGGQAAVLNSMGAIAYWRGRWNEALQHYGRALALLERTGAEVRAATVRGNIGEILTDQGRLEDAEEVLRRVLRTMQAADHRSGTAFAARNLARVASLLGRHDEALRLLSEALTELQDVGAHVDVLETRGRIAEHHLHAGRALEALREADAALDAAESLGAAGQLPALLRARGDALLQLGDVAAARTALIASLDAGRQHDAEFEVALTLRAMADLADAVDEPADDAAADRSRAILERLGVLMVPRPAAPAVTASR